MSMKVNGNYEARFFKVIEVVEKTKFSFQRKSAHQPFSRFEYLDFEKNKTPQV